MDFDIETRRVGFHTSGRFKPDGCEPTAIAASWEGERKVWVWFQPEDSVPEMLRWFSRLYNEADIVTGHYIRKFDLPILNGSLIEHGMLPLGQKLVIDTKCDLLDFEGLSKSQENLSGMLRAYGAGKYHMADFRWREATRLSEDGVKETKKRVSADVKQHKKLRKALTEAGALNAPSLWRP